MKNEQRFAWGLLLALGIAGSASAQLLNGGFEDPVGSEWTFTIDSGSSSLWTAQRSTAQVHSGQYSWYMAYGPTDPTGRAHLDQVVGGLTPGETYTVSGWIYYVWRADKGWAYIQALGGGSPVQTPAQGANVVGSWQQYSLTQTADSGGNLTLRLYVYKYATTAGGDKTVSAYFDDISVQPVPEPSTLALLTLGVLGAMTCRRTI